MRRTLKYFPLRISIMAGAILCFSMSLYAQGDLEISTPVVTKGEFPNNSSKANIVLKVNIPGVIATGQVSGQPLPVTVTIPATDPDTKAPIKALAKATLIANAINTAYGGTTYAKATTNPDGTVHVIVNTSPATNGITISVTSDKTSEPSLAAATSNVNPGPPSPRIQEFLEWGGMLSGVDSSGNVSDFTASLGYDSLTDTASLSYDQLTVPTVDGLVTQMFNQLEAGLPLSLQPNLMLNISNDEILFEVPSGYTDAFMSLSTTDYDLMELDGGTAPVLEPSSVQLLCTGLLSMAGVAYTRRRTLLNR